MPSPGEFFHSFRLVSQRVASCASCVMVLGIEPGANRDAPGIAETQYFPDINYRSLEPMGCPSGLEQIQ